MFSEKKSVLTIKSTFLLYSLEMGRGVRKLTYPLNTCENVDNCEQPLKPKQIILGIGFDIRRGMYLLIQHRWFITQDRKDSCLKAFHIQNRMSDSDL